MKQLICAGLLMLAVAAPAAAGGELAEYCGGGGRIAVERLPAPVRDGPLYNTHRLWIDNTYFLINAADAHYLQRCCQALIDDVTKNRLYDAERGKIWDLGYPPKEKQP